MYLKGKNNLVGSKKRWCCLLRLHDICGERKALWRNNDTVPVAVDMIACQGGQWQLMVQDFWLMVHGNTDYNN